MGCKKLESKRKKFRPSKVKVLFVGESPPVKGTFFYCENSNLARYTKEGFEKVCGKFDSMSTFLRSFKEKGCYLIDLRDEPINNLDKKRRKEERAKGIESLSKTIDELKPARIVVVMKGIRSYVEKALGVKVSRFNLKANTLPFPSHGHQREYVKGLSKLVKKFKEEGVIEDC